MHVSDQLVSKTRVSERDLRSVGRLAEATSTRLPSLPCITLGSFSHVQVKASRSAGTTSVLSADDAVQRAALVPLER